MPEPTQQDYENAGLDLESIGDITNGAPDLNGDGTVTTRLGRKVKTLARAVQDLEFFQSFETVAAGLAGTEDNDFFAVPQTGDAALIVYQNNAGSADEINEFPSAANLYEQISRTALTLGNTVTTAQFTQITNSGSVARGASGITYPAGNSGTGSQVRMTVPLRATMVVNDIWTFQVRAARSAIFDRPMVGSIFASTVGGLVGRAPEAVRFYKSNDKWYLEVDYKMRGDENGDFTVQVASDYAPGGATEQYFSVDRIVTKLRTPAADGPSANDRALADVLAQALSDFAPGISLNNTMEKVLYLKDLQNGAQAVGRWTVRVPAGQSGQNTTSLFSHPVEPGMQAGRRASITLVLKRDAAFNRILNLGLLLAIPSNTGGVARPLVKPVERRDSGLFTFIEYTYDTQGDEINFLPFYQMATAGAAGAEQNIQLVAFVLRYDNALRPGLSPTDEMMADYVGGRVLDLPSLRASIILRADDYASPLAAMADTALASAGYWHRVILNKGTRYNLPGELFASDYVEIEGRGEDSVLRLFQLTSASADQISNTSALYADKTGNYRGFNIEVKGCRYGVHCDTAGQIKNRSIIFDRVSVYHYGNDEYPNNAWAGQNAAGCGTSGGQRFIWRRSTLWAKNGNAFSCHNNVNATSPCEVLLEDMTFQTDGAHGIAVVISSIGSQQADIWTMKRCVIGGRITHDTTGWIPNELENQPADRCDFKIVGSGNSPAVFQNSDAGLALRIDSATTGAASAVTIAGDAVPLLFGNGLVARSFQRLGARVMVPGGPLVSTGFPAAVWGWGDVSGVYGKPTTLAQRLGDRSGSARTLTVTVDGGAPINIVFNANYAGMTNNAILAIINAALGASATASFFASGARNRPHFADEEAAATNSSNVGLPVGTVLAFDGSPYRVRAMTNADDPKLFAGVVWGEDGEVGRSLRRKFRGYIDISDVRRSDAAAFVFGDTFSVAGTAGAAAKGGTQGLFRAISATAVEILQPAA